MTAGLSERLARLDLSLFDHVRSQTAPHDRRVLLALQYALGRQYGRFRYMEIGSHKGGSLQVPIRDPACERILSIDARPLVMPDARYGELTYPGNTTARMLELLAAVPDADLKKLKTIDASTEELEPFPFEPHLAFIDGEHTYQAAIRDARFCRACGANAIAFHDSGAVQQAIDEFCDEWEAKPHYYLRSICVVERNPVLAPLVSELTPDSVLG